MKALLGLVLTLLVASRATAQTPARVDFARDVEPIFRAQCISCHGPVQQLNGFRLDKRSAALRGGTFPVITPFNSAGSRLYLKLLDQGFGQQMPPTGKLADAEIEIIKNWLDQGADWPDALAGEGTPRPPVAAATRIMNALRNGDAAELRRTLAAGGANDVGGANAWTPLMYAALYGNADAVRQILAAGADVNAVTDAGTSALILAVHDAGKTRALIQAGANVNHRPEDGRTPLIVAAGRAGSSAAVKLLLDAGADAKALSASRTSALRQAAAVGDAESMRYLIAGGANLAADAGAALSSSLANRCQDCVIQVIGAVPPQALGAALIAMSRVGNLEGVKFLLERGVDVNSRDGAGRTALMATAQGDAYPLDVARLLLDRGADATIRADGGDTALSIATLRGGPLAEMIARAAGATPSPVPAIPAPAPSPAANARAAVIRSLPLLQKADATFLKKSGCVSCHNNSLTAHTVALARSHGFTVDESQVTAHRARMIPFLDGWRESVLHGVGIPGGVDTVGYIMYGLSGARIPADPATDAMAHYLKGLQGTDGRWRVGANRPPIESSDVEVTAVAMRVLQDYAPAPFKGEYARAVDAAAKWLTTARTVSTEDRAFQIMGLVWAKGDRALISRLAQELTREQRPDGGWAPIGISGMASDAYATGEAMNALRESGIPVTVEAYVKGVRYLLNTQQADGSWYVKSRANPVQAYFESDFPHTRDQFISAAGTNWAMLALIPAAAVEPATRALR